MMLATSTKPRIEGEDQKPKKKEQQKRRKKVKRRRNPTEKECKERERNKMENFSDKILRGQSRL
jgi:hypothetical protein